MAERFESITPKEKLQLKVGDAETNPPPSAVSGELVNRPFKPLALEPERFFVGYEKIPPDIGKIDPRLIQGLEKLRELSGREIIMSSGYRTRDHIDERHKAKPGQHTLGAGGDIKLEGLGTRETLKLIQQIPEFFEGGIGIYQQDSHIHVDV